MGRALAVLCYLSGVAAFQPVVFKMSGSHERAVGLIHREKGGETPAPSLSPMDAPPSQASLKYVSKMDPKHKRAKTLQGQRLFDRSVPVGRAAIFVFCLYLLFLLMVTKPPGMDQF